MAKKLSELKTDYELYGAIRAGEEIIDDREIPEDFTREDEGGRGEED
ncbi:MAG: hypothetical protein ACRC3H_24265 [Lachnospiraceae bacterium]